MGRYDLPEIELPAVGDPFDSPTPPHAIGETVIYFQELDEQLCTAISFLLQRGDEVGRIVTAELSFKGKVNLIGSLFRQERPESANLGEMRELLAACFQIEERRNQIVHSLWRTAEPGLTRSKYTARAKHGLRREESVISVAEIDAIWAHCGFLAHSVDELMFLEFDTDYGEP